MNIRTRLLKLVLAILIPAFVSAAIAVWYVYDQQREEQGQRFEEAAHVMSLLIDKELQTIEATLRALASSPALDQPTLAQFYQQAASLPLKPNSTIVMSDLAGIRTMNTRVPFGADLAKTPSAVHAYRQKAGPRETVITDLFFAPIGKRHDFAVQVPVIRQGQVRQYLALGVGVDNLQPLLMNTQLPAGWVGVIIDRRGAVVARTQHADKFVGKIVRDALLRRILAGEKAGVHTGTTLDGVRTAGYFSRSDTSGWTVVLNVPLEQLRRPAVNAAIFLATILVLVLGAVLVLVRRYAKRTVAPIDALRLAAQRMARGETVTHTPFGLAETDAVGLALSNASAEIARNKNELEARVRDAVTSAERAQRALLQGQKLEALGRLTGGIAHDFNNVLQTLSAAVQLLQKTQDPERLAWIAATCQKAIDRAAALTAQMRSFGRVQEVNLELVDLKPVVATVSPLLKSALPDSIALSIAIDEALYLVRIDVLQFEMTLLNLLINARDAIGAGGKVCLSIANAAPGAPLDTLAAGDFVRVSVADDGAGMSADVLARATEPFFTTKGPGNGSGLGLSQAYGFAEQSRGLLHIDSVQGHGTTVTIWLPRADALPAQDGAPPAAMAQRGASPAAQCSVLFVDDDALIREMMVPALCERGYQVRVAASGAEALAALGAGTAFDVVISDIVMPGAIDGIELARQVRTRFPATAVVLATGYSDKRIDLGRVRALAKPYSVDDAAAAIDAAWRERQGVR
ncbi:response regulator [Massilia sp. CCM 8734]|uniref:hybrid sensor histidine kinase/response regulator n=1 Tax=Massilia sp. CCM 8734 TaxID=2609283 RepID=UPI00141ED2B8|nr:response regulator [Massilia sp. CCM 8734]